MCPEIMVKNQQFKIIKEAKGTSLKLNEESFCTEISAGTVEPSKVVGESWEKVMEFFDIKTAESHEKRYEYILSIALNTKTEFIGDKLSTYPDLALKSIMQSAISRRPT